MQALLTSREKRILELLAKGNTYKQAYAELGISYDVFRRDVSLIMFKLEAYTPIQAVLKAVESRLLDLDPEYSNYQQITEIIHSQNQRMICRIKDRCLPFREGDELTLTVKLYGNSKNVRARVDRMKDVHAIESSTSKNSEIISIRTIWVSEIEE